MGRRAKEKVDRRRAKLNRTLDGRPVVSRCHVKFARVAPRKASMVADLIRNRPVPEALDALKYLHKPSAAPAVEKALKSAIANARDLIGDPNELFVGEVKIDGAPMLKRFRPAAMGRAARIRRRMSHIQIALTEY